jgi:predicted nucleic acid-binding protein
VTFIQSLPPIVVDASAAIDFLGAVPEWGERFDAWAASERMLLAPAHFMSEVTNGQLTRRRIPAAEVALRLERLAAVGIETADRGLIGLLEALELADKYSLTVYDALYLQLALDVDGELATLDTDLRAAAISEGLATTS